MTATRRGFLLTGAMGVATAAGFTAVSAPAMAADSPWTEEFMTRVENTQGFDINAMTADQVDNAKFIIAIAAGHGIGERGTKVALVTSIVEAWLRNYGPEVDGTSGGLFQQQRSMGWGTYQEVRHKKKAIDAFFGLASHTNNPGLLDLNPDYKTMSLGQAAQAVQGSDYPARYDQHAGAADTLWEKYAKDVKPYTG